MRQRFVKVLNGDEQDANVDDALRRFWAFSRTPTPSDRRAGQGAPVVDLMKWLTKRAVSVRS